MNYEELSGKSVLVLGKTRSLKKEEFETLLRLHAITLLEEYTQEVCLIVEGRLMNPLEQEESARLYAINAAPIVSIDPMEEWLCGSIEPNRLLMSLKLSNDQERLVDFIQNPYIGDELFFKLLKLYDWQNEGLFDNDTNRDVTAALIGRFYKDLQRNHNVQYAMSGLAHLIARYGTGELIEAIAELSPIADAIKTKNDQSLRGVLDAMSAHPATPERILRLLVRERAPILAGRTPLVMERELLALNDEAVNRMLAYNPTLSASGALLLEESCPQVIAAYHPLSPERFERLMSHYPAALASNRTLTLWMQQVLMALNEDTVCQAMALNPSTDGAILDTLYADGLYEHALAANPALSEDRIETLSQRDDAQVLAALASNPSTPVDILYQLSLDRRFERNVKANPSFGNHIQTHNIGWQV